MLEDFLKYAEPHVWPIGMGPAANYRGEDERLIVMASFDLDALEGDEELARLTRFAANLLGAPSAMVSMVESERQRFLTKTGLTENETPRSTSFCATTMMGSDILEVLDATKDDRFANYSLVTGKKKLRYYAGAPLISTEGAALGSLCVIDNEPRSEPMTELQREGLLVLAQAVKRRLQAHRQANSAEFALKASAARVQFVLDSVPDIAWSAAPGGQFDFFNARWAQVTGLDAPRSVEEWRAAIHAEDYEATVAKFAKAVQSAELFEDQWRLRQADGSYRWVLSRAIPSGEDPQTARWFGTLTDIDDAYKVSEERELLAGELAHRIKNIFAVVNGLITLQANGSDATRDFGKALVGNIHALSRAQEFALRMNGEETDNLQGLLALLMAPYRAHDARAVTIGGDNVAISQRAATPLALVFHEFATNSAKYGAFSVPEGRLQLNIEEQDDNVVIHWRESDGPEVVEPESDGFGSRLIDMSIKRQLGGTIDLDWHKDGLRAAITIPSARLAQ